MFARRARRVPHERHSPTSNHDGAILEHLNVAVGVVSRGEVS